MVIEKKVMKKRGKTTSKVLLFLLAVAVVASLAGTWIAFDEVTDFQIEQGEPDLEAGWGLSKGNIGFTIINSENMTQGQE